MNIIIVDDEKSYLVNLKEFVISACSDNIIQSNISITDDPVSIIDSDQYMHSDVILLDIDMPEISGIELASSINKLKGKSDKPYIIFVTKKEELVFDALREMPFSFVRKSSINDLIPCLIKINQKLISEDTYVIKSGRNTERMLISEIMYIEKKNNYVIFHTEGGEFKERSHITEKISDLSKHGFLRSHIGSLVNARYIDKIQQQSVLLITGQQVPLSKKYKKAFKNDFYHWFQKIK